MMGDGNTHSPMRGMASGKWDWKNSSTCSPVVSFSNSSKGMKSVQVKDLSCQSGRKVTKKPKGHRELLAPGAAAQCLAYHLAITAIRFHSGDEHLAPPFSMVGLQALGAGRGEAETDSV